jgi:hypothetical protein
VTGGTATYIWKDPGGSISIHLSLEAVERIAAAIEQGLGTGSRGVEIGGILLGRSVTGDSRTVFVDGFECVPFQHWRGASFTASPKDRETLAVRIARKKPGQVVGYFRSHTRPGLYLDQDDFNTISSYFPDPAQVFLVVRPAPDGPATAGFFFWEEGDINRKAPYRQFPLDSERLLAGGFPLAGGPAMPAARQPAPVPPAARKPAPVLPAAASLKSVLTQRRFPQVPWLAVPLLAGVFLVAGLFVSQNHAQKQTPGATAVSVRQQPGLALNVLKAGDALKVRWDPNAPVIRTADLGVLRIRDGGQLLRRELDARELSSGSTTYTPASAKVDFELRVYRLADELDKSIQEAPATPPPQRQVAEAALPPQAIGSTPAPPPAQEPVVEQAPKATSADRVVSKPSRKRSSLKRALLARSITIPPESQAMRTGPREVEPPPVIARSIDKPQGGLAAVLSPEKVSLPAAPETVVSYEQPRHGPLRRMFRKLSNLGDTEPSDGFVPPSPTRKVTPDVPKGDLSGLVEVKVLIDESGKVARAELLTRRNELSGPTLDAAREWHFTPARKHDKPVPSEMVLHFRFGRRSM